MNRIFLQEPNSKENDFISIDCLRSLTSNLHTYDFIQNHTFYSHDHSPRLNARASSVKIQDETISDDELKLKAGVPPSLPLPNYIKLRYRSFLTDQHQSVDMTALKSSSESTDTDKQTFRAQGSHKLNLKDLKSRINNLAKSIAQKEITKEYQEPSEITKASQKLMSMIVEISKSVILNEEQPIRLRVFTKHSDSFNRANQIFYLKEWFGNNMC